MTTAPGSTYGLPLTPEAMAQLAGRAVPDAPDAKPLSPAERCALNARRRRR